MNRVRRTGPLVIDIDATLIAAHSDKNGAAGTLEGGFGFHPLLAFLATPDLPAGGMPLAGVLRPGNAGANEIERVVEHADVIAGVPAQDGRRREQRGDERRREPLEEVGSRRPSLVHPRQAERRSGARVRHCEPAV